MHMKGGEYTVFNWSDVDSPSVEVRRTIQTLSMEVSQIMKVGGSTGCCCGGTALMSELEEGRCIFGLRGKLVPITRAPPHTHTPHP